MILLKYLALICLATVTSVIASEINRPFPQEVATIYTLNDGLPDSVVTSIVFDDDGAPLIATNRGNAKFIGNRWIAVHSRVVKEKDEYGIVPKSAGKIFASTRYDGEMVIGTANGLYRRNGNGGDWQKMFPHDEKYSWAPRNVKVVAFDKSGRQWFGCSQGVGYRQGDQWRLFTGKEGLPFAHFTCATPGESVVMWFGTEKGAIRADGEQFAYRFSRRWLPNDYVNDIAVQEDGTAWIATNGGVSRIERRPMTLEKKAAYFIDQVEKRHNRMGFIADCRLAKRYDVESWQPKISDNDGMYTAMYGAANAFRYAVTGDSQAKELAKRSFDACKWLVDITHEPGFPARVIIPIDWPEPVNEQYGKEYNERRRKMDPFWKQILPRFVKSKDGKYLWKCDTSSDELAGHYFFYGIYYDLVAETEEEKQPVRQVVRAITDHLIRNGFVLRDHDGKPTRWGNFSPEFLNSVHGWEQRGLNSMMMLSFLNVAAHVTGDRKYLNTAQMLRDQYQYHINAMQAKMYFPPNFVVPWDNNLCLMSMYGLMLYEHDPELLLMYRLSLEHAWLHISKQKSAFWNLLYGALVKRFQEVASTGVYDSGAVFPKAGPYAQFTANRLLQGDPRIGDVLETLRGTPLDLIGYEMDNTHRLDIIFDPTPGQSPTIGWHFDGRALPIEERGHVRLDRDGFALYANEDGGFAEHEGTFFLLPYYLGRYHGFIE